MRPAFSTGFSPTTGNQGRPGSSDFWEGDLNNLDIHAWGHTLPVVQIIAGFLLLLAGRRLFWLFVGVAGFITGFALAASLLEKQPFWMTLLIAVGAGLIGTLLSLFLQRLAIFLGGFLAGGYGLVSLLHEFHLKTGRFSWLFFILGGVAGAILLSLVFDWALIFLSSLTGSLLIVQAYRPGPKLEKLLLALLFVAGFAIQALGMKKGPGRRRPERGRPQRGPGT